SEFMRNYFIVQLAIQPIMIGGVIINFVIGIVLEIKNRRARSISYVKYDKSSNTTWMSRNMIYTEAVILLFSGLHMYDFFFFELGNKFSTGYDSAHAQVYFSSLVAKFESPVNVVIYVIDFMFMI